MNLLAQKQKGVLQIPFKVFGFLSLSGFAIQCTKTNATNVDNLTAQQTAQQLINIQNNSNARVAQIINLSHAELYCNMADQATLVSLFQNMINDFENLCTQWNIDGGVPQEGKSCPVKAATATVTQNSNAISLNYNVNPATNMYTQGPAPANSGTVLQYSYDFSPYTASDTTLQRASAEHVLIPFIQTALSNLSVCQVTPGATTPTTPVAPTATCTTDTNCFSLLGTSTLTSPYGPPPSTQNNSGSSPVCFTGADVTTVTQTAVNQLSTSCTAYNQRTDLDPNVQCSDNMCYVSSLITQGYTQLPLQLNLVSTVGSGASSSSGKSLGNSLGIGVNIPTGNCSSLNPQFTTDTNGGWQAQIVFTQNFNCPASIPPAVIEQCVNPGQDALVQMIQQRVAQSWNTQQPNPIPPCSGDQAAANALQAAGPSIVITLPPNSGN